MYFTNYLAVNRLFKCIAHLLWCKAPLLSSPLRPLPLQDGVWEGRQDSGPVIAEMGGGLGDLEPSLNHFPRKLLISQHYVPGSAPGAGYTATNKIKSLPRSLFPPHPQASVCATHRPVPAFPTSCLGQVRTLLSLSWSLPPGAVSADA